jgi:hypothetical protein
MLKKSICYGKVFRIARETSTGKSFSLSFHIYKWTFFVISNFAQKHRKNGFCKAAITLNFFNVIYEANLRRDVFLY